MLFNSLEFLFFLIFVYLLHWKVFSKSSSVQNIFLLVCSLIFYSAWDYRFLILIIFSIIVDFIIALSIYKERNPLKKKFFLFLSLFSNLGTLFLFKYFNFFSQSLITLLDSLGFNPGYMLLKIVLPVGISFYTFQTLSYTIDVYRNKIKPEISILNFSTYVSFFPQLVAGPIERASEILPQLSVRRKLNEGDFLKGIRKILIGFFKKIVIADSLSPIVDTIFSNYNQFSSIILFIGLLYFSIQIYCDFSGYSDIAIGVSLLFGIKLMENFNYPYFSKSIGEFWKRWHISLTSWFRDYLYIPMGGSRGSKLKTIRNVFIVFLISGLWHGANWTYVVWGTIHSVFYIPNFYIKKYSKTKFLKYVLYQNKFISTMITFFVVMISWSFFRSETVFDAYMYLKRIFVFADGKTFILNPANNLSIYFYVIYVLTFIMIEKFFSLNLKESNWQRITINTSFLIVILFFVQMNVSTSFIYFQF